MAAPSTALEPSVSSQVACPEINGQQWTGARSRGVRDVWGVIDRRARWLSAPRSVVAPPLALLGQGEVHLDRWMTVERIVRVGAEQQHADRDSGIDGDGWRAVFGSD